MSLSVRFAHRFGDFSLDVAFEAPAGVTALFGRSGSRQDLGDQCRGRADQTRGGAHPTRGTVLFDAERRIWRPPASAVGAEYGVSGATRFSRI